VCLAQGSLDQRRGPCPYFFYLEGQGKWEKQKEKDESRDEDQENNPVTNGAAGLGYGRVVDIGAYERIMICTERVAGCGRIESQALQSSHLGSSAVFSAGYGPL